jgi:hypothetical protein
MSNKKHLNRSAIAQHNTTTFQSKTNYINKNAAVMNGWLEDGDKANIFVSIRFVQHEWECFSDWSKTEMKSFWAFVDKAHQYTWQNVRDQSRKTDKSGLAYTIMTVKQYPDSEFKKSLDPDITIFELRVNEKARVHCFRDKAVCYVCWLDRNHRIAP